MTKSIVFNLLLFVLFFCTTVSKAQTIELQTPLLNLKVGGVPQSITIKYTNSTGATSAATTLRLAIPAPYKGVYLYSSTAIQANDRSALDFNIRALDAGGFLLLTMTIQAGYCYEFGEGLSRVNLTDVLSVTKSGTALSFTNDNLKLSIDKSNALSKAFEQNKVYRNGESIPISNANMTINATNNDVVVREYVYLNSSSTDTYKGTAELNGPDNLIDPLRVDNLEAYVNDVKVAGGTLDKTLWTLSIPFSVPPNGKLVFKETVIVTGCLLQAETVINFAYGVGTWDNCSNTTSALTPNLQPITTMSFVIDEEHSNYKADARCIADGINGSAKNIIYNYTGEAEASTTLSLFERTRANDVVEKSSVKFYLTKAGGIRTEYQIDWSANDMLAGPAYPYDRKLTWDELPDALKNDPNYRSYLEVYYLYGINHLGAFSVYDLKLNLAANGYDRQDPYRQFPLLVNMFITYDGFLKNAYAGQDASTHPLLVDNLPNGINTELVFSAQVSRYFENGVSKSLVVAKGDKVELEWIEYTTCRNQYTYSSIQGMWTHVHSEDACKNPFNVMHGNYYFDGSANFYQDPGNTNISGEVDLCTQTQDGQIENVSFKLIPNLGLQPEVADLSGKIVFRVYLEDGLDMDRSFEKPASLNLTKRGYQLDGTCTKACDGCDPNDVLTGESYNTVKYVLNNGNELSVSNGLLKIKRVAWKDNATNPIPLDFIKSPYSYARKPASAYYVYEIEMDLATIGIPVVLGKTDYNLDIRDYLYNGRLSFDVRSYCPSNPTGKAGIQILSLYDKCTSATPPQSCNVPFFTRLWPLSSTEYSYQINCPGCQIPGSNIGINSFMRQNTGFLDANQDGFADGVNGDLPIPAGDLVRRSGTEGDIMKAKFSVSMSEGIGKATGLGFTKEEFEADANLMLDNLIVKVTTLDSRTTYSPGTAKVYYQGSTYPIVDANNYWLSGNTAFFRIPAALIQSKVLLSDLTQVDGFHVGDLLNFEADFALTEIPGVTQTSEVLFQAGYTTCETCTTDFFAVSPSFEIETSVEQYAAVLANKEKVFLICTDGGTNFKSVPFHVERNVTAYNRLITSDPYANIDAVSSCQKSILIYNWGEMGGVNNQGSLNMFENECRYFLDPTIPVRSEMTLPKGYDIDRVEILNQTNQANYRIVERYVIPGSQLDNYSDATQNSFWKGTTSSGNDFFGVNLFYKRELEDEKSSYILDGIYYKRNISGATLPAKFFVKDENWLTQVFIVLKPSLVENSNCMPLGETIVFPEDHYVTNIPISRDPNVFSRNTSNDLLASYLTPGGQTQTGEDGKQRNYFDAANAQLQLNYLSDANLTVAGDQLDIKINIKEISNMYQADYPFLVLEGAALDPAKGLEFDGIYWNDGTGAKTTHYPIYIDHNGGKHRILLGINDTRFATDGTGIYPALLKSSNSNYVLRFKYTCSNITDQGCGGNPIIENGLNNNELKITPGYACVLTPDLVAYDAGKYCAKFESKTFSLSSQVYGSDKNPSFIIAGNVIQSPSTVNLSNCETFKYNLELKSCQEGPVKGFDILFSNLPQGTGLPIGLSLPLGLSINEATVLSNSDFAIVQDATNPLLYKVSTTDPAKYLTLTNGSIQVSFDMSISCAFETSLLYAKVTGIASCGGNLSPAYLNHQLVTPPPVFDPISNLSLQCSSTQISVSYTAATSTVNNNEIKLTLPDGLQFIENNSSEVTVNIAPGTLGIITISYPVRIVVVGTGLVKASLQQYAALQCGTDLPCLRSKELYTECFTTFSCLVSAHAGADQEGCFGSTFNLSAVNIQEGYSYTWTGGGQVYNGAVVSVNPTAATTYVLRVVSNTNAECFATDEIEVQVSSPRVTIIGSDKVCPESSGTLVAQVSGMNNANTLFSWYQVTNGNRLLLRGPDGNNSYSHYGLNATTSFEVVVTSPESICDAQDDITVSLYDLSNIEIQAPTEFCIGSAPVGIIGLPAGGYFDGPGVTLIPSGVYTFSATAAGTYDIYYYYPDPVTGCTGYKKHTIIASACCKYALASTEVMCNEDAIRCITLKAVKPVDDGIKGMDFTLRYDRTLMRPTGLPGRGNATLGPVVLNGSMSNGMGSYAMTERSVANSNLNELHVSIFYTGQAPAAADFDGIGDVICIEFKIFGTATAGLYGTTKYITIGDIYGGAFSQGVVDDEHKLFIIRSCVENNGEGAINIAKNNFLKGKIMYHNDANAPLRYDASTTPSPYLITTIQPVTTGYGSPLCNPTPVNSTTTDINGLYTIDLTGGNGLKLDRDINGDYYNSCTSTEDVIDQNGNVYKPANPSSLLVSLNGYDAYLMESITTMRNPSDVVYVMDRKVPGVTVNTTANTLFPTPFQMIASDVNMDRKVRAVDITLVQERAVSKVCEYPQVWNYNLGLDPAVYPANTSDQRSLDWRFVDKSQVTNNLSYRKSTSYPFPAGTTGTTAAYYWRDNVPSPSRCLMGPAANTNACKSYASNFDIHAVMLGDIDGSWRANLNGSQQNLRTESERKVVIKAGNKQQIGVNRYRIPVTFVSQDPATVSLDFALNYEEEQLSIHAVGNYEAANVAGAKVVYNDFENKELLFTSYTMTGFSSSSPVYYLDVFAKNGEFHANMLGSGDAYLNGERVELVVEGSLVTGTDDLLSGTQYGFDLIPNPASDQGEIVYNIKTGTTAKIAVYNTLGQVVTEYSDLEGQGSLQVGTSTWSSGMYQVILFTENSQKLIKKWVIQN